MTAVGSGLAFPALVGPGFWVSTVLGYGVVGLLALTFNQFATRFKSAGSLYTFVAKGLGPLPALAVAGGLVVGYSAIIGFGLSDAAGRSEDALTSAGFDQFAGIGREAVLLVAATAMCLFAIGRGIHWSTRAALVAEVTSLVVLGVVLSVWVARYGVPGPEVFSLEGASVTRILIGAGSIVTLTLAFESSASLALESRRPFLDVPFALRSSLVLAAVLFGLANLVASMRPADAPSVWTWRWLAPGADRSPLDAVVLVVLAWSLVALALCVWCALARLLFSLAREGVLPQALGRVNARGVPMVAALAVTPLALAPPAVSIATGPGVGAFAWDLKVSGGVVICLGYTLVAASLIRFLWILEELSPLPVVAAVLAGGATAAVAGRELVLESQRGDETALTLVLTSAVLGVLMHLRSRRHPGHDGRYVGMHEEALASSVLLPPDNRMPSHGED
ncbi:MAG TPA: APC family permease [Marmoricola sp.]